MRRQRGFVPGVLILIISLTHLAIPRRSLPRSADPKRHTDVFKSGQDGYNTYRGRSA